MTSNGDRNFAVTATAAAAAVAAVATGRDVNSRICRFQVICLRKNGNDKCIVNLNEGGV